MTLTADIAALCVAIDQGDDLAVFALADLLEEQGDTRGAMLTALAGGGIERSRARRAPIGAGEINAHYERWHRYHGGDTGTYLPVVPGSTGWVWESVDHGGSWSGAARHRCLRRHIEAIAESGSDVAVFSTRSAAYLALAQALAEGGAS